MIIQFCLRNLWTIIYFRGPNFDASPPKGERCPPLRGLSNLLIQVPIRYLQPFATPLVFCPHESVGARVV